MAIIGYVIENSKELEWRIPYFFSKGKGFQYYNSPTFYFAGQYWYLSIFPNGSSENNSIGYIGIYLYGVSPGNIKLEYSISMKMLKDQIFKTIDCKLGHGAHKFISRSELIERKLDLVPSGVFTVLCTLKHPESIADKSDPCTSTFFNVLQENKVLKDLKDLYLKKENCDVVINVQGWEFPAHKTILEARSPVFACTFRNDMKEKATGIVNIEDCDPSSFSEFLCFLYCGDMEVITKKNVFSLFMAGDKYDVQDLSTECVKFMKEIISVDTFCDMRTLALRHSETEFIKTTTDFFCKNAKKITLTVEWKSFLAENPKDSHELIVKHLAFK